MKTYDVIVIGGGITGAGVVREAAQAHEGDPMIHLRSNGLSY